MRTTARSVLVAGILLSGCAGNARHLHPYYGERSIRCTPTSQDAVKLTYLGTAGMLMERGDDAIMTAPFFSNPGLLQAALLPIQPDSKRITSGLAGVNLGELRGILVGHAHYDHLMDAIWVAERAAPVATLYGSDTMTNIACSRLPDHRLVSLESRAGDWWNEGQWETVVPDRLRVMAIRSEHAPHAAGFIKLFAGNVEEDHRCIAPRTAWGWKEGQTLAYLVDFLDGIDANGAPRVAVRLYVQDAASNPPYGFPSPGTLAEHAVDLLILSVASFDQVHDYPEALVRYLAPRDVVLTHWDNFFRAQSYPWSAVPGLNTALFAARLTSALPQGAQWHTPGLKQTLRRCLD